MADSPDTDPPTLDALARRYLDLWQDQWGAVARDPVTAENVTRWFEIMAQGAAAFNPFAGSAGTGWDTRRPPSNASPAKPPQESSWPPSPLSPLFALWPAAAPPAATEAATAGGDGAAAHEEPSATGTAPPGSAPGDHPDRVAQLSQRLAVLEERLVGLETGAARPRFRARRPHHRSGS